jgi:choline dehydrogenase
LPATVHAQTPDEFDDIVVGSGSAGSIVAARLSEDRDRSVLLLEAGTRPRGLIARMPAAAGINFIRPSINWCYQSDEQPELHGRRVLIAAGRALGGSSAINAMCYMRGHPRDFDAWVRDGASGWSFADVLPYFKRNEAYDSGGDPAFRGYDGPFVTTKARAWGAIQEAFLEAGRDETAGTTDDPNGYRQEGFFTCDRAIRRGERVSTATAYLDPAAARSNLRIQTDASVHRILIEHNRAIGVEYTTAGRLHRAYSRHEIILSAGTIRSPHLLMLSGIGPADHLGALGIPVVVDLPSVGSQLEDHIEAQLTFRSRVPLSHSRYMRPDRTVAAGLRWFAFRDGIGATTGFEVGALLRSSRNPGHPDMQIYLYPALLNGALPDRRAHGFGFGMDLNRCRSRGTIRLASADPRATPRIDPAYLSDPEDLTLMVEAVERARAIVAGRAFDKIRGEELGPGPQAKSRDAIATWIREVLIGNWHLTGSCRMGSGADSATDTEGRVHGIASLRIVDASIMPRVVNANPAATVMMMAEKISDRIRGRAPLPPQLVRYDGMDAGAAAS